MLVLVALAVPVDVISALVAKALLSLIAEITNLVFFRRLSPVSFASASSSRRLGHSRAGHRALMIGLMARYGSEKIRGHGIPEALEAILLGGSLI